ncbi:SDR family oxidoreductase [Subtercola sp. RTI3]|uniref:SDR family oxidoreductase n=1 Tax=Subtercola sp. RTI3 TaxID=3048639 RepID=UPI002B237ADD|nr:SDR family oxidoreductase [Subtercola sp. RTI3]MEA9984317.1 SDR family oxidoreductase [Subtercola sp. RTI3]
MKKHTALVVGARGVIGGNLLRHLQNTGGWEIIGLSRRGGVGGTAATGDTDDTAGIAGTAVTHIAVDLLDRDATTAALAGLECVTHIFYAAYQDRATWSELVPPNLAMLTNVVDAIEPIANDLVHISLMQGYKVYGAHLGPFKTPAREDDPPHMPPEFNVDQQQFLEHRQTEASWTWSALRPSVVAGVGLGNPMNLTMVIAVYASVCRELGIPFRFPGKPGAYTSLIEMTDADLLAKATVWAATNPAGANQAYNIANGDVFRWESMWATIAKFFELEVAPPLPMSLADVMADKGPLWNTMVQKYDLLRTPYSDVSSWAFGDFVFGWDYDVIADTSKARRAGFHEYIETEAMFADIFTALRTARIIP